MLLKSSSTPILNSWLPNPKESSISSPESDLRVLQRTRSVSVSFHHQNDHVPKPRKNIGKAIVIPTAPHSLEKQAKLESEPESFSIRRQLFSSSGLGEESGDVMQQTLVFGGEGGSGGGDAGSGFFESNSHGSESSTDVSYQKMIEANPGNPLLLGNYAKFLKEIRGDFVRAEEYCGRAILANPNDGNFLSLYAELIWHNQKDIQRAKSYFDQAVKTSPNDCYVLASYARFLWDVEDEDENENDNADENENMKAVEEAEHNNIPAPTDFFLRPILNTLPYLRILISDILGFHF